MGIQGAFDSAIFAATQEAMESSVTSRTMTRWIVNMLKCRNIHTSYQGGRMEAKVGKNCPQGGVLSLPLVVYKVRQPAPKTKRHRLQGASLY